MTENEEKTEQKKGSEDLELGEKIEMGDLKVVSDQVPLIEENVDEISRQNWIRKSSGIVEGETRSRGNSVNRSRANSGVKEVG